MKRSSRRLASAAIAALFAAAAFSRASVPARRVEIPVRVYSGSQFADNLQLQDFELVENGRPQAIESLALVVKDRIARVEPALSERATVPRSFYLMFQMIEYEARIEKALTHLFKDVLVPGDNVTIITPMKPYSLAPNALTLKPREMIAKEMNNLLRKDIQRGTGEYKSLVSDLKRIIKAISGTSQTGGAEDESDATESLFGIDHLLSRYRTSLQKLESLRLLEENRFLSFAQAMKKINGQKIVFFFYEREFLPEMSQSVLNLLMSEYQDRDDILAGLSEMFQYYKRTISFEIPRVKQALSDAGVTFNFVFMTREPKYAFGITWRDQSEDSFRIFSELAAATGGRIDNNLDPEAGLRNATDASEKYYILTYTPSPEPKDGSFRSIVVRVKGTGYTISHKLGYFAD